MKITLTILKRLKGKKYIEFFNRWCKLTKRKTFSNGDVPGCVYNVFR